MRKRIMMTCLVSALMLATGTARAQNRITATRTQSPPVIDGRLDDACWAEAVAVSSFLKMNSTTPAEAKTEAYVLFDERSLYLGFRCYEPDVSTIQTGKRTRGEMVFRDDCVEVMLDPWLSRDEYFHFAVNASGSQYDSFCSQGGHVHEPSWDGDWEAAASIGEGEWTAELRIPFYTLGIRPGVGSIWGINLMREKKLPYPENSSIATQGAFHIAGRFAELVGLDANLSRYCYEIGTSEKAIGTAEGMISAVFKVPVTNLTGSDSTVRVDGWLIDELKRVRSATALHSFQAGERAEIDIGPVQLEGAGTYELVITIKDETTRETLAIQKSGLSIDAVPMAVHVIEPFYRNAIFATQNLREVVLDIEITLSEEEITDKHLAVHVKDGDGAEIFPTTRISPLERMNRFRFPVEGLPHGEIHVHALLEAPAGQVARTSQRLRNLPYKPGEVWLGRNLNWHVDGNPFFPIASWGHQEDTNEFYNVEWAAREGKKRVAAMYYGRHSTQLAAEVMGEEILAYTTQRVTENRDNPDLFGYHLSDEPGGKYPRKNFEKLYELIAELDPYHPVIITHNGIPGFSEYFDSADFHTFHTYPPISKDVRINDLSRIGVFADRFLEINNGRRGVGTLIQSFNYGDYGAVNHRIDTYQEFRTKLHMAVVRGANGIVFFNRCYAHYAELYLGAPALAREFAFLAPALLAPVSPTSVMATPKSIKTLLKEVDGELYLLAVNESMEPVTAHIEVEGIGRKAQDLRVVSENRTIGLVGNGFSDGFDVFETHIYTTHKGDTGLPSVKDIEASIADVNRARRKPGNLAFQRFEGDGVTLAVSSKKGAFRRPDNGLWHLVDGVVADFCYYDVLVWTDATPNEFPDWLEIHLPSPSSLGRVVIYTPPQVARGPNRSTEGALRDYEVQVFTDNEWKTVAAVTENTAMRVQHEFAQITSDRVRIWVTAANGPHSKIAEIEIYEK